MESLGAWAAAVRSAAPGGALHSALEARPAPELRDREWADAVVESLIARQRLIAHLQARQMADLVELGRAYPADREFLSTEVSMALSVAESTAQAYLAEAETMVRRLPQTFAALDAGRITGMKAAVIRHHTDRLADSSAASRIEQAVLGKAPGQTVPELRQACQRAVLRFDPDGADLRHKSAKLQRRMTRHLLEDGMAGLWVESTAPDIATIWEACTALGQASRTPGDHRSLGACRVDALVDVARDILDTGTWKDISLGGRGSRRPHVQVVVPFDAMFSATGSEAAGPAGEGTGQADGTGGEAQTEDIQRPGKNTETAVPGGGRKADGVRRTSMAYLVGYGPITLGQARGVAADGDWQRLLTDPIDNELIDCGRTRYRPPESLRRFVQARDRTCVTPGCRMPAFRTDLDHVVPFHPGRPDGGRTDVDNLACLCRHHHRAKDGGGHHLARDPMTGVWEWTTVLGRVYRRPDTSGWAELEPDRPRRPLQTTRTVTLLPEEPPF